MYSRSHYDSCIAGVEAATVEILDSLDQYIDYSLYDRNPKDGYVDLVYMIYRDFRFRSGCSQFTGFAWLASSPSVFVTDDISGADTIKIDLSWGGTRPSGVTLEGQNLSLALQQAAHEEGHLFFTRGTEQWRFNHLQYLSTFGVMDNRVSDGSEGGAGMAFSAFERERLGWISPTTVTSTTTGINLVEAYRGGTAVKIPVRDSTEYFLVENRAKTSWYDQDHTSLFPTARCRIMTPPKAGAAIYHVDHSGSKSEGVGAGRFHKLLDIELAHGMFDTTASPDALDLTRPNPFAGQDSLDSRDSVRITTKDPWGNGNANTFATYTAPNTNRYIDSDPGAGETWQQTGYTGVSVQNMTLTNDTLTLDVVVASVPSDSANHVVRPASGAYTAKWAGWMYLPGDVVVDSLVTVQVASGTAVKSRYRYDKSALGKATGTDTSKIEIVVSGGATLDVNGSLAAPAVFTSTKATPDTADWYGLRLKANGGLDLDYADVGYGLWGVTSVPNTGTFVVSNSKIHHHGYYGVYGEADADTFDVRDSEIYNNGLAGLNFTQKKKLTAGYNVLTKIRRNKFYGSSLAGGNEVELINLGGASVMVDSLERNAVGTSSTWGGYGLYIEGAGNGTHTTFSLRDTVRHFYDGDGITLVGLGSSKLDSLLVKEMEYGRGLFNGGVSSVTVSNSKFENSNFTHVWNDEQATICLGDETSGAGSNNAFFNVDADTFEIWNWNTSLNLKAENNWWDYSPCHPGANPPAWMFYGSVDRLPKLCTQPTLARPIGGLMAGDPSSEEARDVEISLAASPNPNRTGATIRYVVPMAEGVEGQLVDLGVYSVTGQRVQHLFSGQQPSGIYELRWAGLDSHGDPLPSSVYFLRLSVGQQARVEKVILAK